MSAHTSGEWLLLFCTAAIIVCLVITFKPRFWDEPLKHGHGFFLGVKVAPGFYEGEGIRWVRWYRTVGVAAYLILALAMVAIFISGRWYLFPVWAGGGAILLTATSLGFVGYTRARLGASPPVHSSVAIALEGRRLGDYFWWPGEAVMAGIVALAWVLLLTRGNAQVLWRAPVTMTYFVLGVFAFEVAAVRANYPLPADQPEEHLRWMEAGRRLYVRTWDLCRWFVAVLLGGYALLHGWHLANASVWLLWALVGVTSTIWLCMAVSVIRGQRRLSAMGRNLLPVGSWSTPFRRARIMPRRFAISFAVWFGGLVLLLVFFRK